MLYVKWHTIIIKLGDVVCEMAYDHHQLGDLVCEMVLIMNGEVISMGAITLEPPCSKLGDLLCEMTYDYHHHHSSLQQHSPSLTQWKM